VDVAAFHELKGASGSFYDSDEVSIVREESGVDDFQPMDIKCPNCRADLNVRTSLKQNIQDREMHKAGSSIIARTAKASFPADGLSAVPIANTGFSARFVQRKVAVSFWG
jgi:hypothetical protein